MNNLSPVQIFIIIGAAQGFIIGLSLLFYDKKELKGKFLALGLLALSFRLLVYPFRAIESPTYWEFIAQLSLIALLLVGPFIYLYTVQSFKRVKKSNFLLFAHFAPFLFYLSHLIYPQFPIPLCYSYATLFSGVIYGLLCLYTVNRDIIKKGFSGFYSKARFSLNSFALPLLIIPAAIIGLDHLEQRLFGLHPATFPYLFLTLLLYRMSYKSLRSSKKFFDVLFFTKEKTMIEVDQAMLKKLINTVERQKLYQNHKVTVSDLAQETGFSRHQVSQLINAGLAMSFNDFINGYRVETLKKYLVNPAYSHLSIHGIAQEAGFKSKSTFHQVFKEMTGTTPGEYRRSHLKNLSKMAKLD